jgi:hypothetical protein
VRGWIADQSGHDRWGENWPPMGRNNGRPRGLLMAASGENYMAAVTRKPRLATESIFGSKELTPSGDGWL